MKRYTGEKMNFVSDEKPEDFIALKIIRQCTCEQLVNRHDVINGSGGRCTLCGCMGFRWHGNNSSFCANPGCGHHHSAHL